MAYDSPVKSEAADLRAIGQAMFSFSNLEWHAVWVIEKLKPGFVAPDIAGMTAGQVAKELSAAVEVYTGAVPQRVKDRLAACQAEFTRLVGERNHLVHARPITDNGGKERLYRSWKEVKIVWTAEAVDDLCLAFDTLAAEMRELFYHWLPE